MHEIGPVERQFQGDLRAIEMADDSGLFNLERIQEACQVRRIPIGAWPSPRSPAPARIVADHFILARHHSRMLAPQAMIHSKLRYEDDGLAHSPSLKVEACAIHTHEAV
jgi:hypothetical protein